MSLSSLNNSDSPDDRSSIEQHISRNLDEYLSKFSESMSEVNINSLYNIFFNPSKQLDDHDKAYEFILESVKRKENDNYFILLPSLDAKKMPKYQADSLINKGSHANFEPSNINSILKSGKLEINENNFEKSDTSNQIEPKLEFVETISFETKEKEFNGIIRSLKKISDTFVDAMSEYCGYGCNPNYEPRNVLDLSEYYFYSKDIKGASITIHFPKHRIAPTHYSIRSRRFGSSGYGLRNWKIEGSNDNKTWYKLSEEEKNEVLRYNGASGTFEIKENKENKSYQYIKLTLTGPNNAGSSYILIESIEFFGSIFKYE